MERKALGRGLSALISVDTASLIKQDGKYNEQIAYIPINEIEPNPQQPRKNIKLNELQELSQSIKMHGVLQPIIVIKGGDEQYTLIAGERRWRAATAAGLSSIPAIIKSLQSADLLEVAIIENIQRQDLLPLEEAKAYEKLIEVFGYTQEQLAEKLGKSRTHITNVLRILKLPEEVQSLLEANQLTAGHAKILVNTKDPLSLAEQIIDKNLTVRESERLVRSHREKEKGVKASTPRVHERKLLTLSTSSAIKDPDLITLEKKIGKNLGCGVSIEIDNYDGKVTLLFKTLEQFDLLIYKLCQPIQH